MYQVIKNIKILLFQLESTKILSVVESNMQEVEGQTTKIVQSLSQDILDMFNSVILPKLNMGVSDGIDQAEQISKRWGPKVSNIISIIIHSSPKRCFITNP